MKKTAGSLLLAVVLLLWLAPAARAEARLNYVTDAAGLLTDEEWQLLESNAAALSEEQGCGVYIITVDDITRYVDAPDMETAAETLYLSYDLGEKDDRSGILLVLSMAERDWALFAFGYGNTAFTDFGKQYLSGHFLDDFGSDRWYGGLLDYQRVCGEMVTAAREGDPVDVGNVPVSTAERICGVAGCALLGLLLACIVRGFLKGQLRSVAMGADAGAFVAEGGLELTAREDVFTHSTQTRVYDPPKKDSGSSGGTTTRSSGGSSASGKF